MKNKPLLLEILWILGCTIFTTIIGFALFGKTIFGDYVDLNLHDTYFVIANQHFLIWFFIVFSFIVYFTKENRHSFKRRLPFLIFLILGLGFSILIAKASPFFLFLPEIGKNGWTVYPPLSVHNSATTDILPQEGFFSMLLTPINYLILLQIIVIALMLFAAYKYGKSSNN
ncbi:hypothetical protein [Pedobacter sp. R-06]|uniref:hypothetical protein n=1 Tax=Pedobacter sp. R-06 TaxID=3404051 RepID=UPI003CFA4083